MDCENCGSPLERAGETCAFCGARHIVEPAAEVPLAHQRGEGREVNKTFDDSLRTIQAGVEHSDRMYKRDLKRSKWGLIAIKAVLSLPLLGGMLYCVNSRPEKVDFEKTLAEGVASVRKGDYLNGKQELAKAVFVGHAKAAPHVYYGCAIYSEMLERPKQDSIKKKEALYAFYREMNFARQADAKHPQANYFMAVSRYHSGKNDKALADLKTCLDNLAKIEDPKRRKTFEGAARTLLAKLESPGKTKLVFHSELSKLRGKKNLQGIEVPFGL